MSGSCTVTPGYTFSTTGQGELITNPKLNLLGQPLVTVAAGSITDTEIASVSGTKITAGTIPTSALDTATQAKFGFKNYIANPAFEYWPYGTSFTTDTGLQFNQTSYLSLPSGVTYTLSQQPIVAGTNDTLLLDSRYFLRLQTTSTNAGIGKIVFQIPNARTFSGQTITVSAIVQNISGTLPTFTTSAFQVFGTGGSPSTKVQNSSTSTTGTISNSWSKISAVITMATVNGKTFGTNNDDAIEINFTFANMSTQFFFDIANVQVEVGNAATTFENAISKPYQIIEQVNAETSGRLTLSTGVPVMTSTVTGATSVYFTPYNGNTVPLWDGYRWKPVPFSEVSLSLSGFAANTPFDIWGYISNGVLTLDKTAWTSTTARATAIVLNDGIYTKSGDKFRRWLGTIGTNMTGGQCDFKIGGSGTTSVTSVLALENAQNLVWFDQQIQNTTASWTYASQTWRAANADSANFIVMLNAGVNQVAEFTNQQVQLLGIIGVGTTTSALATGCITGYNGVGTNISIGAKLDSIAIGFQTFYPLEYCVSGTATFNGNATVFTQGFRLRKLY